MGIFEKAKKPEAQKKTMVCRKCEKEFEYDEKFVACPHCMTYNPGWVTVVLSTKDPDLGPAKRQLKRIQEIAPNSHRQQSSLTWRNIKKLDRVCSKRALLDH